MICAEFDDKSYIYLLQLLNEKYYSTTDLDELKQINDLYKILKFRSESWLSQINYGKSANASC